MENQCDCCCGEFMPAELFDSFVWELIVDRLGRLNEEVPESPSPKQREKIFKNAIEKIRMGEKNKKLTIEIFWKK